MALALSLPYATSEALLTATYCFVLFAVVVQGRAIERVIARVFVRKAEAEG